MSTHEWKPKFRVLSLDGGGVRGLSSMLILQQLLWLIQHELSVLEPQNPQTGEILPSEVFDHVVGTSTGGLISIMIVKLNMPISECIKAYKQLIPKIFRRKQFGSCFGGILKPRYSEHVFQKCVQNVFDTYGGRESGVIRFMEEGNIGSTNCCCTVVCREFDARGRRMAQPAFICSHYCRTTQLYKGKYVPYEMWMACRATTAAPTFFKRISIDGRDFADGAFGHTNNPTRKAHFHLTDHVTGYKRSPTILWVNIGTGSPKDHHDATSSKSGASLKTVLKVPFRERLLPRAIREAKNLLEDLEAIATDSDRIEDEMEDIVNSRSTRQVIDFSRLSANNGVAEVSLDDWRSLDKIEHLTQRYLKTPAVQEKVHRIARKLALETHKRRSRGVAIELEGNVPRLAPERSPLITVSRPMRDSQHTVELDDLSPLSPAPISPLVKVEAQDQSAEETSEISPISNSGQGRAYSKSSQDVLASLTGFPGMAIPNMDTERGRTNINQDAKWKRRTTVF